MPIFADALDAAFLAGPFAVGPVPPELDRFREGFAAGLIRLSGEAGGTLAPLPDRLAAAHAGWLAAMPPGASRVPRARFAHTACDALLQAALKAAPLVSWEPDPGQAGRPLAAAARFWPDGIALYHYALELYAGLRAPHRLQAHPEAMDLRLWWSIRENLAEDPALALPFLELLAGETPDWQHWEPPARVNRD